MLSCCEIKSTNRDFLKCQKNVLFGVHNLKCLMEIIWKNKTVHYKLIFFSLHIKKSCDMNTFCYGFCWGINLQFTHGGKQWCTPNSCNGLGRCDQCHLCHASSLLSAGCQVQCYYYQKNEYSGLSECLYIYSSYIAHKTQEYLPENFQYHITQQHVAS